MTRKVLSMVLAAAMVLSLLAGITVSANAADLNATFTKISALTDLTNGEYIIVADHGEDFHAMVSPADDAATVMGDSGVITVANDAIVYDGTVVTDAAIWTITKDTTTGKYAIADKNGKYLNGHGKNSAVVSDTAEDITITESGTIPGTFIIDDTNTTYPHLNYNYNSGNGRFAFYGAINNSASMKGNLFLFKSSAAPAACTHEHTENVAAVAATCTEPGTTAGVRCTDCGAIISGCEAVPALGHDYVNGICSRCGDEEPAAADFSGRYYIAAKRSLGIYFYMTSNLGTASTLRYQADNSGLEILPETITSPVLDHVFRIETSGEHYKIAAEGVEGENNYLGWTSGSSGTLVSEANAVLVDIVENDGVYNITTTGGRPLAFNSSAPNDYFAWYSASTTMIRDMYLVPISGEAHFHSWDNGTVTTAPTCTETGIMTYACSGCNETYTEVIPALGHDFVNGICSRCGAEEASVADFSGKYAIVAERSNGFFFMTGVITDTTIKRYVAVAADFQAVPSELSEAPENGAFVIAKSGTGYTIHVDGLSGNNYLGWTSGNSGALVSEANAPVLTITENQDGTVKIALNAERALALNSTTYNDYFAWYQNAQILDLYLIPIVESAHTHDWGTGVVTTQPTCTEPGVRTYTCAGCNETYTEVIPALGHDYVDGICSRCGAEDPAARDFSGKYYFAAKRASGNYFYMTSDLGTASTSRYQAVDSTLETLPEEITEPESGYVFVIAKSGEGYTIAVDGTDDYLGWTSGNSGILVAAADAAIVSITDNGDGTVLITIPDRNLALNNTSGNNYFAWYSSAQANHIALVPVAEEVDPLLDEDLVFLSRNLNLQSYIGVDYTVSAAKALRDKYSSFGVSVEIGGVVKEATQIASATSYRVFELKTTSTQMTEAITAVVTAVSKTDGLTYHGAVNNWTVRDGIMDLLRAETDASRRQLEVDMLKYGAAAQVVFQNNVDNLADSELGDFAQYATTTNPVISATTSVSGDGVAFRTKSLSLASSIEMQFMFSYKGLTFDNLEARIVHNGETKVVPLTRASSTYAGFSYEGLASNELRKNITVAVYDKTTNQPVTQILTVSIEALAAEKLSDYANDADKLELLNAVMRYGDSAAAVYGN